MHGRNLEYVLLVNAEVDSMGGVIDGGVGIDTKASPRRAAIEKAQAELRQEYDAREERRRELEFLEKGGNPLDFRFGTGASISFQSTSLTDQFVTSEAKGSFALTASPHGDSVESSGRPGALTCRENNTADNLLLFDTENDILAGERSSIHPNRRNTAPSEQSSPLDGIHNAKESDDLAIFPFVAKSQAYARRRSRPSRDSARACSTELGPAGEGNRSSVLPSSRHSTRNTKGSSEATAQKGYSASSMCNSKFTSPNGDLVKTAASDNQLDAPLAPGPDIGVGESGKMEVESDASALQQLHATLKVEIPGTALMAQESSTPNIDCKDMPNEGQINSAAFSKTGFGSRTSSTKINTRLDGDTSNDKFPSLSKTNLYENSKKPTVVIKEAPDIADVSVVGEDSERKDAEAPSITGDDLIPLEKCRINDSCIKPEEEICDSRFGLKNEVEFLPGVEVSEYDNRNSSKPEKEYDDVMGDESNTERTGLCSQGLPTSTNASSQCELPEVTFSGRGSETAPGLPCTASHIKLANKAHEDSILEEARIIEAKRKRIAELSVVSFPPENRRKSHWDFVLEEMAWLANDFMQERLWKTAVAAQISQMVATNGRLRFDKQNLCRMQRKVAHTLAKAITQFWRSFDLSSDDSSTALIDSKSALVGLQKLSGGEAVEHMISEPDMDSSKHTGEQSPQKGARLAVQGYAVRFLQYVKSSEHPDQAEAPRTPDRISDLGIMDWEDQFSEKYFMHRFNTCQETLFYTVPVGAMEDYRKSVELHWSQYEKSVSNIHPEEVETSIYDADADFGSRESAYEDYDGEGSTHYLPGAFEGSKSLKLAQKKRKNSSKSYTGRSYEVGQDLPYGTHSSFLMGKRPSNNINVGTIPTKRVRTASRQRVISPFGAGTTSLQLPNKTDASSGDTNSFQDDQSTVQGGSQMRKGLELESTGEFGKHLQPDCMEISMKPKKKKPKHSAYKNSFNSTSSGGFGIGKGSAYEQRWQLDSMVQNEQRDHSKKRLESHGFESNVDGGLVGHVTKKPKIMKQQPDTSLENINPLIGSIPSPVASQVSNLSNPSKLMKMFAGRDRGRKGKALKVLAGHSGLGNPSWSQPEDQALVVIVHDMGPNWELVSDVINTTLQFKCIFRKPKDCMERHKFLMDKSDGDGADSVEDSGSSKPYPSTIPGIPQGSARQLFQRLRGPMEEDTLKSHFEKIIFIGQQQHSRKNQNDTQDRKQATPVHNSHVLALSQVCPNNLNGVPLTPLDLCDATTSSPDVLSLGYQGSHTSGLAISNQGSVAPVLPTSGSNSMLQASSGMVPGNSLPSPSAAVNVTTRDGHRYAGPRPPSLPIDEQQRMQQYNQMLSGRNVQHSGLPVSGSLPGSDRGVRLLTGGNGMGMMCGMGRGMPMPRPGFQGIGSPNMPNMASGNMLSCTGVGMPNPVNQGASMMRPREALHMMRPSQNSEDPRQMMIQELQLQATQGSQGITPPFNGMSANQNPPPQAQSFPGQHQQQHQMPPQQSHLLNTPHHPSHLQGNNHATATPQQQAYMLRLAKERQLHQRYLHQQHHQQQHQFSGSNASSLPHGQPHSQHHPISSSSLPNNSQIHQQHPSSVSSSNSQLPLASSSPMNNSISQQSKQHHLPLHGLGRNHHQANNGGNVPAQIMKQRQRPQQQLQQSGRQVAQQRQQSQSQQQAKHIKGIGRGNSAVMHQNLSSVDPHQGNGLSTTPPGNQVHEKGDQQVMHLMQQNQGLYSASNPPPQPGKSSVVPPQPSSSQSSPQQKLFTRSAPSFSKQQTPPKMSPHPDHSNQGQQSPSVSSGQIPLSASQQPVPPSSMAMLSSQQLPQPQPQPQPRQAGHSQQQSVQRMLQQNQCQMNNSDAHMQSSVELQQHPDSSTFQIGTTTTALPEQSHSTESTGVTPAVSTGNTAQWKASEEPLYDPSISSLPTASDTEPATSPSQEFSHIQFSGSVTPGHGNSVGTQWQTQTAQQPPPSSPPKQSPSPDKPLQHLQAEQSSVNARPSNSGPG